MRKQLLIRVGAHDNTRILNSCKFSQRTLQLHQLCRIDINTTSNFGFNYCHFHSWEDVRLINAELACEITNSPMFNTRVWCSINKRSIELLLGIVFARIFTSPSIHSDIDLASWDTIHYNTCKKQNQITLSTICMTNFMN